MRVYLVNNEFPYDVNHCYWRLKSGRKRLNDDARNYKDRLKQLFESVDNQKGGKLTNEFLSISITVWVPKDRYKYKNGKLKKFDASNVIKLIEDAYSEYIGIDDTYNTTVQSNKRPSPDDDWHFVLAVSGGEERACVGHAVSATGFRSTDDIRISVYYGSEDEFE